MDVQTFSQNEEKVYAVKHALLIISEAAQKLGLLAPELCPNIPWSEIRGIGNRLRHEYDRINVARIWFMVERDLAPLDDAARAALTRLGESE